LLSRTASTLTNNDLIIDVTVNVLEGINCGTVQRAAVVSCSLVPTVQNVVAWRFDGFTPAGPVAVVDSTAATNWTGPAVVRGLVSAEVVINGMALTLSDSLVVSNRPWSWDSTSWTFAQGAGQNCGGGKFVLPNTANVPLGRNTRTVSCETGSIDPSLFTNVTAGFDAAEVPNGPNQGLWYVLDTHYRMDRGSWMNPEVTSAGTPDTLTAGPDRSACRGRLGLGPQDPVVVNFFTYNEICRSFSLAPLHAAIWAHEGFGTGTSNGHEIRRRIAASLQANDPRRAVEGLVAADTTTLRQIVANTVFIVDSSISSFSTDHSFVYNNYLVGGTCGSAWVFHTSNSRYLKVQLFQSNGLCI